MTLVYKSHTTAIMFEMFLFYSETEIGVIILVIFQNGFVKKQNNPTIPTIWARKKIYRNIQLKTQSLTIIVYWRLCSGNSRNNLASQFLCYKIYNLHDQVAATACTSHQHRKRPLIVIWWQLSQEVQDNIKKLLNILFDGFPNIAQWDKSWKLSRKLPK